MPITRFHHVPRLELGLYPTPVEEMPRLRAALGNAPRLLIKRDDYTGPGFGGNKVRKLEYVFAKAVADGVDTVLTIGNIRSNHCRVTAAMAATLGLECHLILNGKAEELPASQYLDQLYGAVIHPVSASQIRVPAMQHLAIELQEKGRKTMEIPLGASDDLGAFGYVKTAEEIAARGIHPDAIVVCSSSGGTQAGLDAGLQLFGLARIRLIGVSPDDPAESIAERAAAIREGIGNRLGVSLHRPLEVDDRFIGPGYGIPSDESDEALRLVARTEGIVLDPTYTAKAMASLLARIRAREFAPEQTVLFLHTGGQLGLFAARADL